MPKHDKETMLDIIDVPKPCDVPWEGMQGDDKVRNCSQCALSVYNLSAMSKEEAAELLIATGGNICARMYRRADGTIVTDNCPVMLRRVRDSFKTAIRLAATVLSFMLSFGAVRADSGQAGKASAGASKGMAQQGGQTLPLKNDHKVKVSHGKLHAPHLQPVGEDANKGVWTAPGVVDTQQPKPAAGDSAKDQNKK